MHDESPSRGFLKWRIVRGDRVIRNVRLIQVTKPIAKLGSGYDVAISPNGSVVCTMPSSAPAKLFCAANWSKSCELKGITHPRIAWFFDDSERIIVASFDKMVATFDATKGTSITSVRTGHDDGDAICPSPGGTNIVASSKSRSITDSETSLVVYSLSTGKQTNKLVICDDEFSVHRATDAVFTRNGRYLIVCWKRTGNGYSGSYLSAYQWPAFAHKTTISLGEDVQPFGLFTGKLASSVFVSIASRDSFHAKSLWRFSCPSLKKTVVWEDQDSTGNEQSGFQVSPCGKQFTYFAADRVETWNTNGQSMIASLATDSGRKIYSALLTIDKQAFVVGDGAVHVYSNA